MNSARGLKPYLFAIMSLLLLAVAINPARGETAPSTTPGSLAEVVMATLAPTHYYITLQSLEKEQRLKDQAAGVRSSRGRRLSATLNRLRAEALSATTIDPENGQREISFTRGDGQIVRLQGLVPSLADSDEAYRRAVAAVVCRNILQMALDDSLIPFDSPPEDRQAAAVQMKNGYAAANQKDFPTAIQHFAQAQALTPNAPEVYYNLGLAEAKIPGRELRAVVWFGAYLAIDPGAKNAQMVWDTIAGLKDQGVKRFLRLTEEVATEVPGGNPSPAHLRDVAELWAKFGDYSTAADVMGKITSVYEYDTALEKIVKMLIKDKEYSTALRWSAMIRTPSLNGAALRSIAEAQAIAGDMESALRTVETIQDLFSKSTGYQWLAVVQIKAGDKDGALKSLESAVHVSDSIPEAYFKDLAKQYIAVTQARAGDAAAAIRTITGIKDPFQISIAKIDTAEWQAHAGDMAAARQMLAEGLDSINRVNVDSRSIVQNAYQAVKTRIDNGTAGKKEEPPAPERINFSRQAWITLNPKRLNTPEFLDLGGYVNALPTSSPDKIFAAMRDTATAMIDTYDMINTMLKQQAALPIISDSPGQEVETDTKSMAEAATPEPKVSTKKKVTKVVKAKPAVSPVKPIASPSKQYSYQGRQVSLRPEMIFDITGKVENASVFQDGGFLGISVTLKDNVISDLKKFSERNIDQETGLILKGKLVSVAFIRGAIANGRLQISGGTDSIDEMMKLAAELSAH